MKKIILSLVAMALNGAMFAQTNSINSGDIPTVASDGYTFQFNGTGTDNCLASGGVAYSAATTQAWSIDGSGNLIVTVPSSATYESNPQTARFFSGNCVANPLDLSGMGNNTFKITLNSPMAGQLVVVAYDGASSNYATAAPDGPNVISLVSGANTLTGTFDFVGTGMSSSNITAIGLLFRGPTGWSDATFHGAVTISSILVGSAVTTTTGTLAAVNNSLISVYPNPAKDQINIDLSSMNSANALVKIVNSNGAVVYQGTAFNSNEVINTSAFNKGIYMVQVSSENNVSNKKVVIE